MKERDPDLFEKLIMKIFKSDQKPSVNPYNPRPSIGDQFFDMLRQLQSDLKTNPNWQTGGLGNLPDQNQPPTPNSSSQGPEIPTK